MPTFISIEPDPFADSFRGAAIGSSTNNQGRAGSAGNKAFQQASEVRRPVRGLQLKNDTYATLQVRTADGVNVPLIDAGGKPSPDDLSRGYTYLYTNFLLQGIQEQRSEKMQVVQTFGEPFVFFFGEHPRVISGSGILLNTEDFNWRAEFWENYDLYLRGTKCVQRKTRITLQWDDIIIEGYFIKANAIDSATKPNQVEFDFQIFLTNYQNLSPIGNTTFPKSSAEAIALNPDSLDTTGEGIGNLVSATQEVRSLNTASLNIKNSLFSQFRDSVNRILTLDGKLTSFFEAATRITSGRNIRVPIGFAGGSVFDQETQIALASVNIQSQQIILRQQLGNQTFTIQANLANRFLPNIDNLGFSTFGTFRKAEDEYIARQPQPPSAQPIDPSLLDPFQKIDNDEVVREVTRVFMEFGLDVEPPSEAVLFARRAAFGIISVGIGASIERSKGLAELRETTNIAVGSIVT